METCAGWGGERQGWEGDAEEGVETWDRVYGGGVEGGPGADLPDVPPEMLGIAVAEVDVDLSDESWRGIR